MYAENNQQCKNQKPILVIDVVLFQIDMKHVSAKFVLVFL